MEMNQLRNTLLAIAALLLAWASTVVSAGSAGDGHGGDHDRARQALEAGEVLPLRVILERVEARLSGADRRSRTRARARPLGVRDQAAAQRRIAGQTQGRRA
jgi:hypothetical protein